MPRSTVIMSRLLLLNTLFWSAPALFATETVQHYGFEVVESFPHDIDAFTQGLTFHEGYLYEGTGKRGRSRLSQLDLESGETLRSLRLPDRYFGEGIAVAGDRLFQLTWQSHMVFVYDLETFESIDSFYNPTEGWGLTYDGVHLIHSDGSDTLRFIEPDSFRTVREIQVTEAGRRLTNLNELEYINGEVWANIWYSDSIVRIDPTDGRVTGRLDLSSLVERTRTGSSEAVLNGIAWDAAGERLLVTGKHWDDLFQIELVPMSDSEQ